jgi:hypothetical protein
VPHKNPGPQSPEYLHSEIRGTWNVATEIRELAARNPAPAHGRPGAANKAVPANDNAHALPGRGDG